MPIFLTVWDHGCKTSGLSDKIYIGLGSESVLFLGETGRGAPQYWGQLCVHMYCTLDCTVDYH